MKTHINLLKKLTLFSVLLLFFNAVQAQDTLPSLKEAIAAKQFVFEAQTVLPTSGRSRQVGSEGYKVRLSGDTLVSELPYFGRAYTAPINPSEGGIRFTTTQFGYVAKDRRKGGWEISIRPKGATELREFVLNVSENGFASLQALSNNRQPISFTGTVRAAQKSER